MPQHALVHRPKALRAFVLAITLALHRHASTFTVTTIKYGPEQWQVGDLLRPANDGGKGLVMLIHGGFWKAGFTRSLMVKQAEDLVRRGLTVWNVDYRSVGSGGGYPGTLQDATLALDWLMTPEALALGIGVAEEAAFSPSSPLAVLGHSAGGHLASWLGCRPHCSMKGGPPGPKVRPSMIISQAGVVDLISGYREHLGDGAVKAFLGTTPPSATDRMDAAMHGAFADVFASPSDDAEVRYAASDPISMVRTWPADVSRVPKFGLVHGAQDMTVPVEQSELFHQVLEQAAPGCSELRVAKSEAHFEHLDTKSECWRMTTELLATIMD